MIDQWFKKDLRNIYDTHPSMHCEATPSPCFLAIDIFE